MPVVIVALRRAGVLDSPTARSSHTLPTLRGGGVAIILGVTVASLLGEGLTFQAGVAALGVPLLLGAVGFTDDLKGLGVVVRFGAQLALGAVAAGLIVEDATISAPLALLAFGAGAVWVAGFLNVFNFMDGINGISGVTAALVAACYLAIGTDVESPQVAVLSAAVLGASLAFLPFNFPRARVFLGDSGSYFIGAAIALAAVGAVRAGASVVAVAAPLVLYLTDTGSTLVRRMRRGERWWEPHREHTYQRIANGHLGHVRTTALVGVATAVTGVAGLVAVDGGVVAEVVAVAVCIVVVAGYLSLPAALDRRVPVSVVS